MNMCHINILHVGWSHLLRGVFNKLTLRELKGLSDEAEGL